MFKRLVCIFTALVMVACCFSACGKSGGGSGSGNRANTSLPELEIKSDTVKWLCWDSQEVLDDPTTALGFINKQLQEKYGCRVEVVRTTYQELTSKAIQLILSDQAPDMVFFKMADFPNFILNGLVDDVSKHIDTSDPFWDYLDENPLKYRGVNYNCYVRTTSAGRTYYNRKMFENAGLETPYELFKKDQWTWSKFLELSKELTQDTNRDGTVDIYGGTVTAIDAYMSCGEDFVKVNQDGTFENNIRSPQIAKFMDVLFNINKLGCSGGDIWKGNCAMLVDSSWQVSSYVDKFTDGVIGVAAAPKMDGADKWYTLANYSGLWLSKGAKNPGGALAWAAVSRWLQDTEDGRKVYQEYKDLYDYPADVEEVTEWCESGKNQTAVLGRVAGVGNFGQTEIFTMFNSTVDWGTPWSTNVETTYPILQAQIDSINKKLATENEY